MTVTVRPLVSVDHEAWLPLWQGYLEFYAKTLPASVTAETWRRIHDPLVPVHALGAIDDGVLIGFATYLFHHSTWTVGSLCYLEDLYTAPSVRGRGAGRALIEGVATAARGGGAERLYWQTHRENTQARILYDQVAQHSGFIVYSRDV
jgi:GNAT superfamily N-acetyltransferase